MSTRRAAHALLSAAIGEPASNVVRGDRCSSLAGPRATSAETPASLREKPEPHLREWDGGHPDGSDAGTDRTPKVGDAHPWPGAPSYAGSRVQHRIRGYCGRSSDLGTPDDLDELRPGRLNPYTNLVAWALHHLFRRAWQGVRGHRCTRLLRQPGRATLPSLGGVVALCGLVAAAGRRGGRHKQSDETTGVSPRAPDAPALCWALPAAHRHSPRRHGRERSAFKAELAVRGGGAGGRCACRRARRG